MKIRSIIGLFIVVIVSSCFQQSKKGRQQIEESNNQQFTLKNGLQIDNGINRGMSYTDTQGTDFNIRYIPITITNDSTIPIQLQIVFSKEYFYPTAIEEEKFKVIPLPKEWAMDGEEITDSMLNELPLLINKPLVNKTIKPNETIVFGIGTLYARPPKICGVLPNALLSQNNIGFYRNCKKHQTNSDKSTNSQGKLWLKLDFCRNSNSSSCTLISSGQISYL